MRRSSKSRKSLWFPLPCRSVNPKGLWKHLAIWTHKSALFVIGGETFNEETIRQNSYSLISSSNDELASVGNSAAPSQEVADVWFYKARSWNLSRRPNAPPSISSSACSVWGSKIIIFGGRTSAGLCNDMFICSEGSFVTTHFLIFGAS